MITLEAIRTALTAADPYEKLDQIVVSEMASGRKVQELFDAIHSLLGDVLDMPGLSKDGEEAILGTLDKLTGDCLESQCYRDSPAGHEQVNGKHASVRSTPLARGA